jgi:hypothetical protein
MRRTVLLAVLLLTGCGAAVESQPIPLARAAEPRHVTLDWLESHPSTGKERLRFAVNELTVRPEGWSVGIAVTNATRNSVELGINRTALSFGLMLFPTGDLKKLKKANREGRMPAVRLAAKMEPTPPDVLAPGATWRATLSSHGSLADGSFVRVVFGPFRIVGKPPTGMGSVVYWFTDRSYKL